MIHEACESRHGMAGHASPPSSHGATGRYKRKPWFSHREEDLVPRSVGKPICHCATIGLLGDE